MNKKNELFDDVDLKMTNLSDIVSLFSDAVTNVHEQMREINNFHSADLKFYETSVLDKKLMDDSFLTGAEELTLDTLDNNPHYQELRDSIIDL